MAEVRCLCPRRWECHIHQAGTVPTMLKRKKSKAQTGKRPQDWSAAAKLQAVLESAELSDDKLGEFLRRKGLHEAQLAQWRELLTKAAPDVFDRRGRKKPSLEKKRIRELEKELGRKDKALAETAALLVLKKKALAIWGDEDDNTDPRNGR